MAAIAPAAIEDPDPLEGDTADGGMVALAVITLLVIMLPGPLAGADGAPRPFMKGLPNELGAGPAPVDPLLLATGLPHRSDARKTRQALG
jgi:hypothetical protein